MALGSNIRVGWATRRILSICITPTQVFSRFPEVETETAVRDVHKRGNWARELSKCPGQRLSQDPRRCFLRRPVVLSGLRCLCCQKCEWASATWISRFVPRLGSNGSFSAVPGFILALVSFERVGIGFEGGNPACEQKLWRECLSYRAL